jgi:hypothetical protein
MTTKHELIEKLQRENDASRAELAARAAEREADPARAIAEMIAEHRSAIPLEMEVSQIRETYREPIGTHYVQKSDDPAALVYRTTEIEPAPATCTDGDASDDDPRFAALAEFTKATVERFQMLDRENAMLRARVDTLTAILAGNKTKSRRKRDV